MKLNWTAVSGPIKTYQLARLPVPNQPLYQAHIPTETSIAESVSVAKTIGSIVVDLQQIPNQPIKFNNDPSKKSRVEDQQIAWTWKTFLDNKNKIINNPFVLLQMPMTKACVKAMDAAQEFIADISVSVPQKFVVTGVSKSLNGWTFAFKDYYQENITRYTHSSQLEDMAQIIDPYSYIDRYRNTKLLQIQGTSDEFFLPDNENLFWNNLTLATGGTNLLNYVPNQGHGAGSSTTMITFFQMIADNQELPKFHWQKSLNATHGTIVATVECPKGLKPSSATGYQATTANTNR
ncbi:unnamed protein product, partial [Didymodactylos carnosus]